MFYQYIQVKEIATKELLFTNVIQVIVGEIIKPIKKQYFVEKFLFDHGKDLARFQYH